jgi:glucose/arabinose dehydrogenase
VPWSIDVAPDGRLFLTERPGRIRVIGEGTLQREPWAVLPAASQPDSEMGLLGIAIDPDFADNAFVYAYYTTRVGGRLINRLVRLREDAGRGVVDRVLLDEIPGAGLHDGGRVKIGPDRRIYVTVGDAEQAGRAQNPGSPNGKILRLERDGSIPADNPFSGSPVLSLGHRHPQGLAFDEQGRLYATEHGPSGARPQCCNDEVNLIEPGANYGWPQAVGLARDGRFRDPVATSGPEATWAPSGATFVTSGPLRRSLFFTTLRGQHLHRVVLGDDGVTILFEEQLLVNRFGRLRDVIVGPDGALLVLTSNRDGRARPAADDDRVLRVVLR